MNSVRKQLLKYLSCIFKYVGQMFSGDFLIHSARYVHVFWMILWTAKNSDILNMFQLSYVEANCIGTVSFKTLCLVRYNFF